MNSVKTRKVGNSLAITIPKELNIEEVKGFIVYKGVNNVIVLAPKIPIPFDSIEPNIIDCQFDKVVLLNNEE
ncbi:hypothetical protein Si107_00849 [Streptococcus infantarius subsp. infantarius]|nr:hypothetical protein [Streptococcus infantarius subsp. infantarius]